ncbi:MAG: divalent metal cation transporter [Planctomycetia bacterium]|nr:divalent metal cation transporter [Planctomycetia bacterium]
MSDDSKGLPMTAKWNPEKLEQEIAQLEALEKKPALQKIGGYIKRSGPGLLQSAMTLGAGSAAASVVAGASFGYKLLWVQPLAMFLGVCMLAALSNVVLTTQERPYGAFGKRVGWILVALWAFGTIFASVIWHFPQYGLAAGATRDLAQMAGMVTDAKVLRVDFPFTAENVTRWEETLKKEKEAAEISIKNGIPESVSVILAPEMNMENYSPLENVYLIHACPAPIKNRENLTSEELKKAEQEAALKARQKAERAAAEILAANEKSLAKPDILISRSTETTLSSLPPSQTRAKIQLVTDEDAWNTAVAVMAKKNYAPQTYYSNPGKGISYLTGLFILAINIITVWSYGSSRRGIMLYEWFLRILIALVILAFTLVVACNIQKLEFISILRGFLALDAGSVLQEPKNVILVLGMLGAAVGINMTFLYPYSLLAKGWGPHHRNVAKWDLGLTMFLPFTLVTSLIMIGMTVGGVYNGDMLRSGLTPLEASSVLTNIVGPVGRVIFDLGLIGMACGAISTHMVVCGFTLPEMFGLKYTKWTFRLCALLPVIGVLGVITNLPFWFPIVASAICFTMLPIAYFIFLLMNNNKKYIGNAVGKGMRRVAFNCILCLALIVATLGSFITINDRVIRKISKETAEKIDHTLYGFFEKAEKENSEIKNEETLQETENFTKSASDSVTGEIPASKNLSEDKLPSDKNTPPEKPGTKSPPESLVPTETP